jgi:hypothetical protein
MTPSQAKERQRRLAMTKRMKYLSIVVPLALGLSGCAANYVEDNASPVMLRMIGITPSPMTSDVFPVSADTATVTLAVRSKNPNFDTVPQVAMAVFMERYEVSFFRSDGRGVEGVDVPYRISGALNGVIDAATSGGVAFNIEVVRAQAKMEPPLANLRSGGQSSVVTMFADVVVHGRTTAGEAVQASARVQIDFADY